MDQKIIGITCKGFLGTIEPSKHFFLSGEQIPKNLNFPPFNFPSEVSNCRRQWLEMVPVVFNKSGKLRVKQPYRLESKRLISSRRRRFIGLKKDRAVIKINSG